MKYYDVIALSVGGLRNKIFRVGDRVCEEHFQEGRAKELEVQGFLKFVEETDELPKLEAGLPEINEKKPPEAMMPEFKEDDVTRNEIIAKLKDMNMKFNANASKAELYEVYMKAKSGKE